MSVITIQCRLVAKESTRHQLWQLMAGKNTPLINELLKQVANHPDFDTWQAKGKIPAGTIKKLCEPLRKESQYIGQPGRFYTSAIALVEYIYKSWLKIQQRLKRKLEGLNRWYTMLKSDEELVRESNSNLELIRALATEMLTSLQAQNLNSDRGLSSYLFDAYEETKDIMTSCAIAYLLKNGCKIPQKPEDSKKFAKRRRKTEIKIARITEQLESRIPKGRDLTGERWLETLITAASTVPENITQTRSWQDILLTKSKSIPFPVAYETNEDLTWFKNEKGRLCVYFNGLSEHTFEIYCDRRQLFWFERFLSDQEIKRANKDHYSSALFTLRSGRIAWKEGSGKGDPWNVHRLILFCSLDTRLKTAEGTEQIRQEKADEIAKTLTKMKEKGDLNDRQQAFIRRKHSTLARLNNPFPRPSNPLYQGQSNILVGVAMGLDRPATVAVVDVIRNKAITYRSIKQLLGDNYKLLNRQRQQNQALSHLRHIAQRHEAPNRSGESELGQYLDRLIAKAIVTLAQTHRASSIVVPKLDDMRELIQTEIQHLAEQKIPGYIEAQKQYAKEYRINIHQWSYGRLIENITAQATKVGIAIEQGEQTVRASPQEKAQELALYAYRSRLRS